MLCCESVGSHGLGCGPPRERFASDPRRSGQHRLTAGHKATIATEFCVTGNVWDMEVARSDAKLIAGAARDATLFGVIYNRHGTAVRRYLARRVGS